MVTESWQIGGLASIGLSDKYMMPIIDNNA